MADDIPTLPAGGPIRVVLDSNVLIADLSLASGPATALLAAAGEGLLKLVVPRLVIDEVVHHYAESAEKAVAQARRLGLPLPPSTAAGGYAGEYEGKLTGQLAEVGALIAPYPQVSHADMARRFINRVLPFETEGKGYRDALVWYAALEQAQAANVALVSTDKIFRQDRDHATLTPSLILEVEQACGDAGRVVLYISMEACAADLIESVIEVRDELAQLLATDGHFRLATEVALEEAVRFLAISPSRLRGASAIADSGWLISIDDVDDIQVVHVGRIGGGAFFVTLEFDAVAEIELFVHKSEIAEIERNPDLLLGDADWNEKMMTVGTSPLLGFRCTAIYRKDADFTNVVLSSIAYPVGDDHDR